MAAASEKSATFYDYALLLSLAAMFGASFLGSKIAVEEVPPITVTLLRQVVAMMVFVLLAFRSGGFASMSKRDHIYAFLTAVCGTGLPFILITWSVIVEDAGVAAVLMGFMPLLTLILAHYTTTDESMDRHKLLGVFLGMAGLIVLFWPDIAAMGTKGTPWHKLALLLAASAYAVNTLLTKQLTHLKPQPLYLLVMMWTVMMVAPLAFWFEAPLAIDPSARAWIAIIALGLFPSALAAIMVFIIIQRQGAAFFGQINFLVPLFGVFWAFLFLGERLPPEAIIALFFILFGVALARRRPDAATQLTERSSI